MPIIVVLALLLGAVFGGGPDEGDQHGPLPAITASAPSRADAEAAPCASLLAQLPITLGTLAPRRVVSSSPYVVAWGDPAVVLRCGVGVPDGFGPGSDANLIQVGSSRDTVSYFVSKEGDDQVFTAVDRQAFVSFSIPGKYQGADYLTPLNKALLKAMPKQVCLPSLVANANPDQLCDRRH